ncbi:olfactory receptor-like protein OLF3 [Dendrobates tinctorius]|uniref:olfactory receptor-like protein OLF3 n=1 Tax=Dendrobates tinctorius TaxID=92724 RepID=UPI003CCA632C
MDNQSIITEVILLGFSTDFSTNVALFVLFLGIYLITISGNVLIVSVIIKNSRLHVPMYFFLCNLSLIDLCYSSTAVPRLLADLFTTHRTISILACGVQLYIILFMGGTECQLLVLMAYDRFIAICRPLHYPILMRWSVCYQLIAFMWVFSFMINVFPSLLVPLKLCHRNQINHFMCELLAITKLSCEDIHFNEVGIFSISFFSLLLPFVLILVSYICILSSVLLIRSAGRSKAFSTCTSHVTVVLLYFGTAMFTYFGPSSQYSSNREKYTSIFYVIICPMLNPLIYSTSNREVKKSLAILF